MVLMGYYNPIYIYGVDRFVADALEAGADGLIVVDLPPEEDRELCLPALATAVGFVRLATPTTAEAHLPAVLTYTAVFIYYLPLTGAAGPPVRPTPRVTRTVDRIRPP